MKIIPALYLILLHSLALSQRPVYTTGNAHSHNDYKQKRPFWSAYEEHFGSIEADIFLLNDSLFIAHDRLELLSKRTLVQYYLEPLVSCIKKNKGFIYRDTSKRLQLLIDIKTNAINTLAVFIKTLQQYPSLINNKTISWVISGNRPGETSFNTYPSYIYFDGDVSYNYSAPARAKIKMLSANFKNYSLWNGKTKLPDTAHSSLQNEINKVHHLNKPVRLWAAPDNPTAWKTLMGLGVDYINTDKIGELSRFITKLNPAHN